VLTVRRDSSRLNEASEDLTNMVEPQTYYRRHLPHYQPPDATFHVVFRLAGSLPAEVLEELRADRIAEERHLSGARNRKQLTASWSVHQKEYFEKFDALLDGGTTGPRWLADERIAGIVAEALRYRDGKDYDLLSYCIMPNHVHAVLSPVGRPARQESFLYWAGGPHWSTYKPKSGRDKVSTYRDVFTVRRDLSRPNEAGAFRRAEARRTVATVTELLRLIKGSTARACNAALRRTGAFWQHESYDHVVRNGEELEQTIWYVLNNPVKARLVDSWEQWQWTYCKPNLV
jgi:putative transposase